MVYPQPRIRLGEWDSQTSLGFWDANGLPNLGQKTEPSDSEKKKKSHENLMNSVLCRSG